MLGLISDFISSMVHCNQKCLTKKSFQAITLLDLRNKDDIMRGANVVQSGDFKKPFLSYQRGKSRQVYIMPKNILSLDVCL